MCAMRNFCSPTMPMHEIFPPPKSYLKTNVHSPFPFSAKTTSSNATNPTFCFRSQPRSAGALEKPNLRSSSPHLVILSFFSVPLAVGWSRMGCVGRARAPRDPAQKGTGVAWSQPAIPVRLNVPSARQSVSPPPRSPKTLTARTAHAARSVP